MGVKPAASTGASSAGGSNVDGCGQQKGGAEDTMKRCTSQKPTHSWLAPHGCFEGTASAQMLTASYVHLRDASKEGAVGGRAGGLVRVGGGGWRRSSQPAPPTKAQDSAEKERKQKNQPPDTLGPTITTTPRHHGCLHTMHVGGGVLLWGAGGGGRGRQRGSEAEAGRVPEVPT